MEHSDLQQGQEVSQQHQSSQFITPKFAGKNNICCVCRSSIAKYTCPKCQQKTCGLTCNKKHKQLKSCTGLSNPAQYLPIQNMNQKTVRKDFTYVKQLIQATDKVKKCLTGVTVPSQQPKRFKILRFNAKKLHNITIVNAPNVIQKHIENISFYFVQTKQIYWVFQLLFYTDQKWIKHVTLPTSDSKTFKQLIITVNFLSPQLIAMGINTLKINQFQIFIQNKIDQKKQMIQLYQNNKISQSLKNIKIYQYPTLLLIHQNYKQKFYEKKNKIYKFI